MTEQFRAFVPEDSQFIERQRVLRTASKKIALAADDFRTQNALLIFCAVIVENNNYTAKQMRDVFDSESYAGLKARKRFN